MDKSPEAFRTISEVAEVLETPAHVLRFWESRFPQIRPVKRAGGRRYYRPSDVALLTGIKRLLHDEGLTIRGVQKILREQGIRHVAGLTDEASPEQEALEAAMVARFDAETDTSPEIVEEATAAALEAALDGPEEDAPLDAPVVNVPEAPQSALDWLASLPSGPAAPQDPPAPPEPAPESAPESALEPPRPALSIRSVTGAQTLSTADTEVDVPTATLAARLRALPRGSLKSRQEPLQDIAQRMARLRDRLSGHAPLG